MVTRILSIFLLAATVSAQTLLTPAPVNYNSLNPETAATQMVAGTFRIRAEITDGAEPIVWAGITNADLQVIERTQNYEVERIAAEIQSTTSTVFWSSTEALPAGSYHLYSMAQKVDGEQTPIYSQWLTVTAAEAAQPLVIFTAMVPVVVGGNTTLVEATFNNQQTNVFTLSLTNLFAPMFAPTNSFLIEIQPFQISNNIVFGDTYLFTTNNITVAGVVVNDPTEYGYAGGTSTPTHVQLYSTSGQMATGQLDGATLRLWLPGGNGTGDGFNSSNFTQYGSYYPKMLMLDTNGQTFWSSEIVSPAYGGISVQYATNYAAFSATADTNTNEQAWVVPSGVTQIFAKAWGAGAASFASGSASGFGMFAYDVIQVTPGETLRIFAGQGGKYFADGRFSYRQLPGGGLARTTVASVQGVANGGAWSGLMRGTNPLMIASGGGVNTRSAVPAYTSYGGIPGRDGYGVYLTNVWYGSGGTTTSGGSVVYNGNSNYWDRGYVTYTNYLAELAGRYLQGGDATNNVNATSASGNCGGGGGGLWGGAATDYGNNPDTTTAAFSGGGCGLISASGYWTYGPNSTDPDYVAGVSVGATTAANGGDGRVVIRWATP